MQVRGLPELADDSVIAHWRAAHRLSRWLTRRAPAVMRRHPGQLGLRWEPLECHTIDGLRLAGWVVEPRRPCATVLLFHALRQNRQQTIDWSHWLAAKGCRSVAFDHRAHGESEGWRTSFGWWERLDVQAVTGLAVERWPAQPRAAVGLGLGASALCFTAAACRLDAVILQGVPAGVSQVFEAALAASRADVQGLLHMVKEVTERRLGMRLEQLAPAERVPELPSPVLVQPGSQDVAASADAAWPFLCRWLR